MAATSGIYLTHPTLAPGDAFDDAVAEALEPMFAQRVAPKALRNAPVDRNGAQFTLTLTDNDERDRDPAFDRASAILVVAGKPTEERVALARALAKLLAKGGFESLLDDENFGRVTL